MGRVDCMFMLLVMEAPFVRSRCIITKSIHFLSLTKAHHLLSAQQDALACANWRHYLITSNTQAQNKVIVEAQESESLFVRLVRPLDS